MISNHLEQVLAKQALHELNVAYARAADRLDYELMLSIWAPAASVDVGVFAGDAAEYSHMITQPNPALLKSSHMISNEWYRIEGDNATGETYVTAATVVDHGEGKQGMLVGGRYLDRFVRLESGWKILYREFVLDWHRQQPLDEQQQQGFDAHFSLHGCTGANDRSYSFL